MRFANLAAERRATFLDRLDRRHALRLLQSFLEPARRCFWLPFDVVIRLTAITELRNSCGMVASWLRHVRVR